MNIKLNQFLPMMVLLCCATTSAQAQSDLRFLHDTPITKFKEADRELLIKTLNQALDNGVDGATMTWENSKAGNSGRITPSKDPEGRSTCRKARIENRHQTMYNATEEVFCKVDGKWKVVSK